MMVQMSSFHPRNCASAGSSTATGWLTTRCRKTSSISRRFSTKSDSKRFITLFSGSGGMTRPGLDSTIVARSAMKWEKRFRHVDVLLVLTSVVVRRYVVCFAGPKPSWRASSTTMETSPGVLPEPESCLCMAGGANMVLLATQTSREQKEREQRTADSFG